MHESWEVLSTRSAIHHPFITVDYEEVRLPDGRVIADWPRVHVRDYANAFVVDDAGRALVLEGYKHGIGRASWQVLGGYLELGEDPLDAIQRELLEETGYEAREWQALGGFVVDANRHVGVGHMFLALGATRVAEPDNDDLEETDISWVPIDDVARALSDGRIACMSYATNVALALLHLERGDTP